MVDFADRPEIKRYTDIPGWFYSTDKFVFDAILDGQDTIGDLVEFGAYLGRSAVVIADHQRADEQFFVIDLFGNESLLDASEPAGDNKRENTSSYENLTRQQFERNFLALHPQLPHVVEGPSSEVLRHVKPESARFVHIDASHLYPQVAEDIRNARKILQPAGVLVFDDYRSEHTPGVAAAVWEAVANSRLKPFALTAHKMYATWGDIAPYRDIVERLIQRDDRLRQDEQTVRGVRLIRIVNVPSKPASSTATISQADLDKIAAAVVQRIDQAAARATEPKSLPPSRSLGAKLRHRLAHESRRRHSSGRFAGASGPDAQRSDPTSAN